MKISLEQINDKKDYFFPRKTFINETVKWLLGTIEEIIESSKDLL